MQHSLDPAGQERHPTEPSSVEDHQDGWELEHLLSEEMLRGLVLFRLEKRELQPAQQHPADRSFLVPTGGVIKRWS